MTVWLRRWRSTSWVRGGHLGTRAMNTVRTLRRPRCWRFDPAYVAETWLGHRTAHSRLDRLARRARVQPPAADDRATDGDRPDPREHRHWAHRHLHDYARAGQWSLHLRHHQLVRRVRRLRSRAG